MHVDRCKRIQSIILSFWGERDRRHMRYIYIIHRMTMLSGECVLYNPERYTMRNEQIQCDYVRENWSILGTNIHGHFTESTLDELYIYAFALHTEE